MRLNLATVVLLGALITAASTQAKDAPDGGTSDGAGGLATENVLPFPDFYFKGSVGRTIADSDPPEFPQPVRPPKGAPNIVYILIDDAGYGQFGTFGGQV